MVKIITYLIALSIIFSTIVPAYAMESLQKPIRDEARIASREAIKEGVMQEKIAMRSESLNIRAYKEINRRIESLNKLITKINKIKRLTIDQKTTFINQIQTEIANLQALSAKIKTDTDPEILKADVQSIINSYRVYALFIPKIEVIAAADRIENVADEMSSFSAKLKIRLDSSKASGNDIFSLQALLDDMNAKITDAKSQSENAINAVLPLTPNGYPGNKSILRSVNEMLKAGHQDLVVAHHDSQNIVQGLHNFFKDKNGSSSGFMKPIKSEHISKPTGTTESN